MTPPHSLLHITGGDAVKTARSNNIWTSSNSFSILLRGVHFRSYSDLRLFTLATYPGITESLVSSGASRAWERVSSPPTCLFFSRLYAYCRHLRNCFPINDFQLSNNARKRRWCGNTVPQMATTCGTQEFWDNWTEVNMLFVQSGLLRGPNAPIISHISVSQVCKVATASKMYQPHQSAKQKLVSAQRFWEVLLPGIWLRE